MTMEQKLVTLSEDYRELQEYIDEKTMLVCDGAYKFLKISKYTDSIKVKFDDIEPNPKYETVLKGMKIFKENGCNKILAVGGGSAMDVAKCIKLYSNMDDSINYLQQKIEPNEVELYAVPTTAGTGSEATRYAVIYYNGEKQSVSDYSCIPSVVFMDESVLETLPIYQKKATMLDALCHATESYWSVNSNDESKQYSRKAIELILEYMDSYMIGDRESFIKMLEASNLAGKAINITQTTAGHAMCYKLTSLYGISHGHAAALCVQRLWPFMINHSEGCIDARGKEYLEGVWQELSEAYGCKSPMEAVEKFVNIVKKLELSIPAADEQDYDILKKSVNPVRLKNNPVGLEEEIIDSLYHNILKSEE